MSIAVPACEAFAEIAKRTKEIAAEREAAEKAKAEKEKNQVPLSTYDGC